MNKTTAAALETATAATTLAASGVGGDGGHILNAANLEAGASKSAQGGLGTGTEGLGAVATGGPELHVEGGDAELLELDSSVLGGKHGSVGGGLIAIGLDLHAT